MKTFYQRARHEPWWNRPRGAADCAETHFDGAYVRDPDGDKIHVFKTGRGQAPFAVAVLALVVILAGFAGRSPRAGGTTDPAAARVDAFDNALLDTMKAGPALGVKGRARKLTPAVEAAFDLPTMTRFAVGPNWAQMTPAQQSALTAAFTRLTVASYAHNFDSYGGERFDVDPNVQTRGADKIVQCQLIPAHDKPVNLIYRMRQTADGWKIIDVYYDGVSQLTTRRVRLRRAGGRRRRPGLARPPRRVDGETAEVGRSRRIRAAHRKFYREKFTEFDLECVISHIAAQPIDDKPSPHRRGDLTATPRSFPT